MKRRGRDAKQKVERIDTLIGKDTYFNGEFRVQGTLRIDGEIEGKIEADGHVIIGETGKVRGDLNANSCHIAGTFEGNLITQNRCEIAPSGVLLGHAKVGTLVIEDGAVFSGTCEMTVKTPEREFQVVQEISDPAS